MFMILQNCMRSYYYITVFINRSCNCACVNDMYAKFMTQEIFPKAKSVSNNNGKWKVGKMYSSFLRNGDQG